MSGKKGRSGRKAIFITERDIKQIECLAGLGVPLNHMAAILAISPRTLDNWLKLPHIRALYKKGVVRAELTIAEVLFQKARSGCVPAIIWYEKTRFERSERSEVNHSGSVFITKKDIKRIT